MNLNMNMGVKIVYFIFFTGLIVSGGFFGIVVATLAGEPTFYIPFIVVTGASVIAFMFLAFFTAIKKRTMTISAAVFSCLAAIALVGNWGYNAYIDSLKMVTNRGVDLYDYQPFEEGTKVATLENESSFHIEDELPMMDGATALYPVYAAFAQALYPEKEYDPYEYQSEVASTQTDVAYERLINGDTDVIFVAGPSESQVMHSERVNRELNLTPIGREAFVFFVNSENPVDSLTVEEIQGIYSGEITNWSEVGGEDESIRAFQRSADSGSQTALENLMGSTPLMDPPTEDVASGMGGIISDTADYHNYSNAIGYSFRYFSTEMVQNGDIKHIEIEGVYPDKDSIRNETYPIAAEFYAVTAGSDNPHVDDLIDWVLTSEGQELIEKSGYVPIN
nr:substrate-binding domain-containing protein [Salipaludibacillus keqinensis]